MMVEQQDRDAAVWRRAKQEMTSQAAANGAPCRPDAMVLAAFLDGRAGEEERRQVEIWLAGDPDAASFLHSLTPLPEAVAAPEAAIARAQAIVQAPAAADRRSGGSWFGTLGGVLSGLGLQWSAVAAAMLLVAVAGFEVGKSGGEALTTTTDYVGLSAGLGEPGDTLL